MRPRIVLAFSGGLDTNFCVPFLREQGYEIITCTVDTGGFSEKQLRQIEKRSKELGAIKHYTIDAREQLFEKVIKYLIMANGLYQGVYPNMCADRYIIAENVARIAKKHKTNIVTHGSTKQGNDQVRFDLAFAHLMPNTQIVTPIREHGFKREQEVEFLEKCGFRVDKTHRKYSVNQNLFGCTISGSEIDELKEPDSSAYCLTGKTSVKSSGANKRHEYVTIDFENGVPVALDGKKLKGHDILIWLNKIASKYAIGRRIYTGDCIVGIKGHILFETPGIEVLLSAHNALKQITLTAHQLRFNAYAGQCWADLIFNGLYFEPLVEDLHRFFESNQRLVTGRVKLKLVKNQAIAVEVSSRFSLINKKIANYAQSSIWSGEDAVSFIRLYGMQQRLHSDRTKPSKE